MKTVFEWIALCLMGLLGYFTAMWQYDYRDEPKVVYQEVPSTLELEVKCFRALTTFEPALGTQTTIGHPWCFSNPYLMTDGELAGPLYGPLPDGSWGVLQKAGEVYEYD